MFTVLREPSTPHPHGLTFAGAILWRGIVYGAADGVLLSAFPILAIFGLFASKPLRERSKRAVAGIGALALAVSLLFTAVYHAGYPDFRGSKVQRPLTGDVIWSVADARDAEPARHPDRAHRHARHGCRSQLRHRSLPAAAQAGEMKGGPPMTTIKEAATEFLAHKRVAVDRRLAHAGEPRQQRRLQAPARARLRRLRRQPERRRGRGRSRVPRPELDPRRRRGGRDRHAAGDRRRDDARVRRTRDQARLDAPRPRRRQRLRDRHRLRPGTRHRRDRWRLPLDVRPTPPISGTG